MSMKPGSTILFVTDELFLPVHNGSAKVYADVAALHKARGSRVLCISFYRSQAAASSQEVRDAYSEVFDDFLFLPGWNGRSGSMARIGFAFREAERWVTGNVFPTNPFVGWGAERGKAERWIKKHGPVDLYVHKIHAAMLLSDLAKGSTLRSIIDLHDDFISKELQYQQLYRELFIRPDAAKLRELYPRHWLRSKFSRVNPQISRAREMQILGRFDEIRAASSAEARSYTSMVPYPEKVSYVRWEVTVRSEPSDIKDRPFDFGFIGSDDLMNVDGGLILIEELLPRLRARGLQPQLIIGGRVARTLESLHAKVPGVTYVPHVADLGSFYGSIRQALIPLRYGAGVSIKLLEALEAGVPAISTIIGARGVGAAPGLIKCGDFDAFADQMQLALLATEA